MNLKFTSSALLSFALIFTVNAFGQINLQDNLLVHLSLNGTGTDISGNGNHATVSTAGAYPASDRLDLSDSAMFFNGALEQGALNFGTPLLNNRAAFSMSFWFNPASLTNGMSLVGQDNILETGFFTGATRISIDHPTSGSFNVNLTQGVNVWQHLAITCSNTQMKVYLNGSLVNTLNGNYSLGSNSANTMIGGNVLNQNNNSWFRGKLDEVRFYTRVLTQDEIDFLSGSFSMTLLTGTISPLSYCAGSSINIPYTVIGSNLQSGNEFTALLSDASGSFTNARVIGSLASTANGTINATLPANIPNGTGYKIKVVSSLPQYAGAISSDNITISNSSDASSTLTNGRILYYNFNANTNDLSGNSQHGTATGGTSYTTDRFGNTTGAIQLNGTNGYVAVPAAVWFNGDYTVSCWVKPNTFNNWSRVYDFGRGQASDNIIGAITQGTNGRVAAENYSGSTTGRIDALSGMQLNQWNHFLVVFSGNQITIYVNGVALISGTSNIPRYITRNLCYIGRSNWSADAYANAAFDDFMIYNRALSLDEIRVLHNDGIVFANNAPCNGNMLQLNGPGISGATYSWSGPAGFSSTQRQNEINNVTTANSGNYSLTITSGVCPGYNFQRNITINNATSQPSVTFTGLPDITNLTASNNTLTGSPTGGFFTGNGMVNNVFNPGIAGLGTHIIIYNYPHSSGCFVTAADTVSVFQNYDMSSDTVIACNGGFYDSGGANGNYGDNENIEKTFCSGNSDFLQFIFTQSAISANDSLFVYDGSSSSSPLIGIYTVNSTIETITSTGSCITFRFKSDGSGNSAGWKSEFSCVSVQPPQVNFNMSGGVRYTCGGIFYDDGGPSGNYNDAINRTQTFHSNNGNRIQLDFTSFSTFNSNDFMRIYDGPNTSYPEIGWWCCSGSPGTVTSTGTSLTITFNTNNANSSTAGWAANISCTTPPLTVYDMSSGTVNACSGAFYDNGGANANYSNNENRTQTFCSDNGDFIQFIFNNNAFGLNSGDTLFVYDGANSSAPPLAFYVSGSFVETLTSSGTCLTFKFVSDGSTNSQGWAATFNCVSSQPAPNSYNMSAGARYVCSGTFYDDGGAGGNYNDAVNRTQTFYSYNGNRIKLDFTSFSTFNSNDFMRIYDGPNTSYPEIGWWCCSGSPGTVTSTGTSLTITFNTNNANSSTAGWAANISCTTPPLTVYDMSSGTVNACSGAFYDNGGANANYSNNENRTQTFCSDNGDFIQFIFNNNAFGLNSGDTMFVYDGANSSAPPLAFYVSGSFVETLTSSGTCLTFKFVSDGSTNSQGWAATFNCVSSQPAPNSYNMSAGARYVCSGTFYDDGGAGGNYNDAVNRTQTFYSYNGNRIKLDFTSFSTFNSSDFMRIYDGPNTSYPEIGWWCCSGNPGTVTSTGTSLTITFNTNNANSSTAGWAANISCTTPPLTVYDMSSGTVNACSGAFYDNGGANANYSNNENRTQTFCSDNGDFIQFIFNNNAFGLNSGDTMFVYDGANSSAPPLAFYVSGSFVETLTSSGTCLTFKFVSDGSTNSQGWAATFNCVSSQPAPNSYNMSAGARYVCSGTFYDDGGAGGNYNDAVNRTQTFYSYNGNRIKLDFTSFSTFNSSDFMRIYDGPNTSYPEIGWWCCSGSPGTVTSTGTSLTITFNTNNANSSTAGWAANISCTTPPLTVYNMSSGTVNACSGAFYDAGGANANYPNNENREQTFCSDNGEFIQFIFNNNAFGLSANDTLSVFDGASTSAQPIAVFVAGSYAETITSTGTCLTFKFTSDGSGNSQGWQASFACTNTQPSNPTYTMSSGIRYTCNGTFYDDGGPSGNYNDAVSRLQTFISTGGCGLRADFTSFSTFNSSDYLRIYDGPNTSSTLIGTYSGGTSPGLVQSSGTALTFQFITNNANSSAAGWAATLSCPDQTAPPVVSSNSPVCEGDTVKFTVNNIPGANFSWTGPDGFTSTQQNPQILNAPLTAGGTYSVVATVGSCSSNQSIVNVAVAPATGSPTVTNNGPLCSGDTVKLTCSTVPGATYSWTGPNAFSSSQQNPVILNAGTNATGTYTVTATVSTCTSQGQTAVTVNQSPGAVTVSSNSPLCEGSNLNLTASASNTVSYSWSGPNSFSSANQNPSINNATTAETGTYTVTAINGSCTKQNSVFVNVAPIPATPVPGSNSPLCSGNTLSLTCDAITNASYSWSGPNGFTSSLQNPAISNAGTNASGIYTVTATVNGCSSQASTSVTVEQSPGAVTASSNSPLCEGSDLNLTASASNTISYSWSGPNSFSSANQNPSINNATTAETGTYTVTAINGSCSSQNSVNVTVSATPSTPVVGSNSPVCSGTSLNLTCGAITNAAYSWSGPDGFSSSSQNPVISNVGINGSGYYIVTATVNGCSSVDSTNVTVEQTPAIPTVSSNSPVCEGLDLNLTSGAVGANSYSWSGPNGFTSNLQNTTVFNVSAVNAGTYTVTATNGNGTCSSQNSLNVSVSPVPATPVLGSNSPVCSGTTLNLTSSAITNAVYSWTGPNGFNSPLQNPSVLNIDVSASGYYILTATVNGCSSVDSVSVTVNQSPGAVSASSNSPLCEGDDLNLTASASNTISYSWSGPNSFSSSVQNPTVNAATTAASGTYTVTATNGNCSTQNSVTVSVSPVPSTPALNSNSPVCEGGTLNLSSSTITNATYSWTGPNGFNSSLQNPSINNVGANASGIYTMTANVGTCVAQNTISVTVTTAPNSPAASGTDTVCDGGTINLFASTVANATYSWTGPNGFTSAQQNPVISSATFANAGTYSVVAIENGCSSSASTFSVAVNTAAPTATANSPLCEGSSIQLSATTISGASYNWTGPNGFSSSQQNPVVVNATSSDAGTYSVTAIIGSCVSTASTVSVTVNALPAVPTITQNGNNLTSSASSGNQWYLNGNIIAGATSQNYTPTQSGTYTVTVTVNGCSSTSAGFNYSAPVTYCTPGYTSGTALGDFINGVSLGTISNLNTGSTGGPSYNDYTGMSTNLVKSSPYTITITGGDYFDDDYAAWIDYNGDGDFLDAGEKLGQFSISSPYETQVINFTVPASANTGSTRLRVRCAYNATNMNPCNSYGYGETEDYTVVIQPSGNAPVANFTANTTSGCAPLTVQFSDQSTNSPTSWNWNFGDGGTSTLQNPSHTYTTAGTYTVTLTVTNANGNDSEIKTSYITVNTLPPVPTITQNGGTLTSSSASGNQWYLNGNILNGEINQTVNAATYGNGNYTVTVTNGFGCTAQSAPYNYTGTFVENVNEDGFSVNVFPNPNNGNFMVRTANLYEFTNSELKIYNLLGEVVYSTRIQSEFIPLELNLPQGLYNVKVYFEEKVSVQKVMVL